MGTKELVQVQQGTITVEVADQSVTLEAGDAVAFPGDVAHSYANPEHAAGEVLPGRLRAGCGLGVPVGGPDG